MEQGSSAPSLQYLVFGIENPLLDISKAFEDQDESLLTKYNLVRGQQCLATEEQLPIFEDLWALEGTEKIPGGSCLNTIRAANFMLQESAPSKTAYFGCIGKDEYGAVLEEELKRVGVHGFFHKDDTEPTGTAAILVNNLDRTIMANLAACKKYPTEHLLTNIDILAQSKILYTTAYFITSNFGALQEVCKFAAENNKPLGYNLAATFLIKFNKAEVNEALEYADYVFCNETEAAVFGEENGISSTNVTDIAITLAKWPKKNILRERVAIITQGKEPIIVVTYKHPGQQEESKASEPVIQQFEIEIIDKEKIIDTNGAGDSFVGGFLASLALEKDLETAIKAGIYLSGQVIQRSGCTFPEKSEFEL